MRPMIIALLACVLASTAAADETDECKDARRAANYTSNLCSASVSSCSDSCAPARDAAIGRCDSALSSERGWCEANDPTFLSACYSQAGSNHRSCMSRARAISTCGTDECTSKDQICARVAIDNAKATVACAPK